jgi:integrase
MKIRVKYVVEDTDRHGNVRLYLRKDGRKVRLRGPLGCPDFWSDYHAAMASPAPEAKPKPGALVKGSMRWLVAEYFRSAAFKGLDPKTQATRRGILERFCANVPEGQTVPDGDRPFAEMLPRHIRKRRDAMSDRPEAANGMVKVVRQVFKYALQYDLVDRNPVDGIELLKSGSDGYHSWTLVEIEQFEKAHPVGTVARLAMALALYTGQRRGDLVQFGKQHVRDGWLIFTQNKGRNRHPIRLELPIIPALRQVIDASPTGDLAFLATAYGRPFTNNGFGNKFRDWCNTAGLPHCSVHGLRKAAAARLAELGCTEFEIMAITGHQTSKEVTRYTKAASQKTRAESALLKMTAERN